MGGLRVHNLGLARCGIGLIFGVIFGMGAKHGSRKWEFQLQAGAGLRVYKGLGCENRKGKVVGVFKFYVTARIDKRRLMQMAPLCRNYVSSTEREEIEEDEFQSVAALDSEENFLLGGCLYFLTVQLKNRLVLPSVLLSFLVTC